MTRACMLAPKGRKNYASASPITRAFWKKKTIMARYAARLDP